MKLIDDGQTDSGTTQPPGLRAAQYVRMSTEHQRYSTENQMDAIRHYADACGFSIVRTYADKGKSGLRLEGRAALKQLLFDVQNRRADYSIILVYDVSRWGRFQDADESAYYEFVCKGAGLSVCYCAESFENDGSVGSALVKHLKRAMAGEYSRDLSTKVFVGHCRLAGLGFHQGAIAGYGLRRQLIDHNGHPKELMQFGQRKSLQTDRVVLVPGPPEEVETVNRIYRLFAYEGRSALGIAKLLNTEGKRNHFGRRWKEDLIHDILTNEKYAGHYVYNKVSLKLGQNRCINAPEAWVRTNGAFEPIVTPDLFRAAQAERLRRRARLSDDEMIWRLRKLLSKAGHLSAALIDGEGSMPSSNAYKLRFGTLGHAYERAGFAPRIGSRSIGTSRHLHLMRLELAEKVMMLASSAGSTVTRDPSLHLLRINGEFSVSVVIARCLTRYRNAIRWRIRLDQSRRPNITVAARMDEDNQRCVDYFILPHAGALPLWLDIRLHKASPWEEYRFESLEPILYLVSRTGVGVAA